MATLGERPLWTPNDPVRILIWGPPKMGKTFGAGTAPRPNFLDFDAGIKTLQGSDFIAKHGWRPYIRHEQFKRGRRNSRGVVEHPEAFDLACKYFDDEMTKHSGEFDTWVLDSCTSMIEVANDKAIYLLDNRIVGAASNTRKEALKHGLVISKIQDYGAERSMTEQFIDMLFESNKHVIVLCHEYEETNDEGTVIRRGPLLTGKSRQAIPLKFDEVYRIVKSKHGRDWSYTVETSDSTGVNNVGSRLGVASGTPWEWPALYAELVRCYNLTQEQTSGKQTV